MASRCQITITEFPSSVDAREHRRVRAPDSVLNDVLLEWVGGPGKDSNLHLQTGRREFDSSVALHYTTGPKV